jgi:alpha-amylase
MWLLGAILLASTGATNTDPWLGRSIYFIVSDRFSSPSLDNSTSSCAGSEWCGGNIIGIKEKLPYIKSMGFDAVWITPVVEQVDWRDTYNGTGYHGYWARDFYKIDPHFGTEEDLEALVVEAHEADMLIMLDVVANHVGPLHSLEDVAALSLGLNSITGEQFHTDDHDGAHSSFEEYLKDPLTMMDAGNGCWPYYIFQEGSCDYSVILDGWFGDLGDLNHENESVAHYLTDWISYMVTRYNLDGIRLDTALYIPKAFLKEFQESADVYMTGEVVTHNISLHASYQKQLTGLLNFPMTEFVKPTFSGNGTMSAFAALLDEQNSGGEYGDVFLLTNFIDNHDGDRFLYDVQDTTQFHNAIAWALLWHGVPATYYGSEVESVASASDCRTSMWGGEGGWGGGAELQPMGKFLQSLNGVRTKNGLGHGGVHVRTPARVVRVDDDDMVFQRGGLLVAVNNRGIGDGSAGLANEERICVTIEGGAEEPLVVTGDAEVSKEGDNVVCFKRTNFKNMPVIIQL